MQPLNISNISKNFGDNKVLENVNIELKPGEIFGLVGLNGVGKTTLIKIMLDLLRSDDGEVKFFGEDHKLPSSRKNIAYLPEKFHPSQFLKGEEFISLSLSYYKKNYSIDQMNQLAQNLDLDPKVLKSKISKYSKGMGQKLGLLSVLLSEVSLLILDEPMSGLDPKARIELKRLLKEYIKQNRTIFFTSHILSDIDEICDRVAILDNGKIIFIGTPAEFKSLHAQDNLEKAFIKAINLN